MNSHELNREGKRNVEAELRRRGAACVKPDETRKSHLYATNASQSRTVKLRVKTKRKGNWHTTSEEAKPTDTPLDWEDESNFWVFVDLGGAPRYWIVPDRWIRNDIHEAHQRYLNKHGGHRAKNDDSNHHSIDEKHLENWQNKWEIFGILFATEQEYLQCPSLQIGKEIGVPGGIVQIDGYIPIELPDDVQTAQKQSAVPEAFDQITANPPAVDMSTLTVREGRLKLVEYFRRERNREIIKAKKQQVLRTTGCLTCEVCDFDFERMYGRLGRGFCEVHHKVPLAEVDAEVTTQLEDLAMLCANCHRMVHRTNPFKSLSTRT